MRKILAPLLFVLFLVSANSTSAYYDVGNPIGYVNDQAGVFSVDQRQALESKLTQVQQETGNEIAVVTIPNLRGDTIENFAVELFQRWGIGKKGRDNGVLVFVAVEDRQMRIEVGYGLEGALTDAQSSWIVNDILRPAFRDGNYFSGVDGAVDKIIAAIRGENIPSASVGGAQVKNIFQNEGILQTIAFGVFGILYVLGIALGRSKSFWLGGLIGAVVGGGIGMFRQSLGMGLGLAGVFGLAGLLFDYLVSRVWKVGRGGTGRYWWLGRGPGSRGGFGGGGFGGFGGGSSGGGGASGRW